MSPVLCGLGIQEPLGWVILAFGSLMRSQSKDFFILLTGALSGNIQAALFLGGLPPPPGVSLIVDSGELDLFHDGPGEPWGHISKGEMQVTAVPLYDLTSEVR